MASTERSFRFFDFTTQLLHSTVVLADILALLLLIQFDEVIHHTLIEIFASQMGVAVSGNDLEHTVVDGEQTDVEGAAAQVKHKYIFLAVFLVQTVRDRSGSRLIDNPHYDQAGNCSSVLGGLYKKIRNYICGYIRINLLRFLQKQKIREKLNINLRFTN